MHKHRLQGRRREKDKRGEEERRRGGGGDTGQDKEWIGLRLKKRERERILFLLPNLWPNCDLYQ